MNASLTCPECGHSQLCPTAFSGERYAVRRAAPFSESPARSCGRRSNLDRTNTLSSRPRPALRRSSVNPRLAPPAPVSPRLDRAVAADVTKPTRTNLPGWVYPALGFAGAMTLISTVVLIRSFRSPPPSETAKPAQEVAVAQVPPPAPVDARTPPTSAEPIPMPPSASSPVAKSEQPAPPAEAAPPVAQAEARKAEEQDRPALARAEANMSPEQPNTILIERCKLRVGAGRGDISQWQGERIGVLHR